MFGIVATSAVMLFIILGLIFLYFYSNYKYDQYKEMLEEEEKATDENGNPVQLAALNKIFKYKKPGVPDKLPSQNDKTPVPTLMQSPMPMPMPMVMQPQPPTQLIRVIRNKKQVTPAKRIVYEQPDTEPVRLVNSNMSTKKLVVMQTPQPEAGNIFQRIVRKIRPQAKVIKAFQHPNYVVDDGIKSPTQIQFDDNLSMVEVVPSGRKGPKIVRANVGQVVTSRTPSTTLSGKRLIVHTPTDQFKKPVILNPSVGESKNAFKIVELN